MKSKLKFLLPLLLVIIAGTVYKVVLSPAAPVAAKQKVAGTLVTLTPDFLVNLADGHYAKFTAAVSVPSASLPAAAAGATTDPTVPEEPAIRAIITNDFTNATERGLLDRRGREHIIASVLRDLQHNTDTPIIGLYLTDLTAQ
jgi:flagellar basal body-associated protein FliL